MKGFVKIGFYIFIGYFAIKLIFAGIVLNKVMETEQRNDQIRQEMEEQKRLSREQSRQRQEELDRMMEESRRNFEQTYNEWQQRMQ